MFAGRFSACVESGLKLDSLTSDKALFDVWRGLTGVHQKGPQSVLFLNVVTFEELIEDTSISTVS